jgi:hypothetical protein
MQRLGVNLSAAIAAPELSQIHNKSRAHQTPTSPWLPAELTQARYTSKGKEIQ